MFGQNPVAKAVQSDGATLHVVKGSPFYTIQGEGPFSGMPAVFIRLHGCPLRCYFCDTNFSDPLDPDVDVQTLVNRAELLLPSSLGSRRTYKLAVITGGEPTRQPLDKLIGLLLANHWRVQVETAGVFYQACLTWAGVYVIVSPKTPVINDKVRSLATAFKYVITAGSQLGDDGLPLSSTQVEGAAARLARPNGWKTPIYLSPMDEGDEHKNRANRMLVGALAMQHGYLAGLQVHKFLDLP